MKKLTYLFLLLVFAALALPFVISACSEDVDCSSNSRKMMNVGFYKSSITSEKDTLDSLTVTAFGTDSILVNKEAKVVSAELPLRWTADVTTFVFNYAKTTTKDTLTVKHTNVPTFISMDCGFNMAQSITDVQCTKHFIKSFEISYKTANTDELQNLKLYY
jgi:hypothetical protein